MKKLKRLLSFALTLVMVVSMLSVCAVPTSAATGTSSDPIIMSNNKWHTATWTHDNQTLTVYNKIVVPSQGYIDFTIEKPIDADGEICDYRLNLYNEDGIIIWKGNKSATRDIFSSYYSYKIGLNKGTYYMEVDPYLSYISSNDEPITTDYKYVFTKSSAWEIEGNNEFSTANTITLEKTYNGVLHEGTSGEDHFKVKLTKGKKYTVTFGKYNDDIGHYFYDPDQDQKSFTDGDYDWYYGKEKVSNGKLTWTFTAEKSGYHYIRTYDFSPNEDYIYTIKVATVKTPVSSLKFKLSTTSYTYNGKVRTPGVTVTHGSKTLKKGTDYTVTYASGRKAVGTYKVTVKMKGDYTGTKTLTFKINAPVKISKCKLKLSTTSYAYNGKVRTPSVKVTYGSKTLKKNTDYTVTYAKGRKNIGTYKVIIKGKGKYTGTKTLTFKINPTTKTSVSLVFGKTAKIGAKSNKRITYSSSDKSVATVNSKGVITAKKVGTAKITVKSGGVTQKITVKVKKPSVKITASKNKMYIGTSLQLKATTDPAKEKVTWSVNNKKLAKISSGGKLKALKKGTVTVTAKFKYKGKTYKNTYKVKIDVEYPDVSVFISSDFEYDNLYGFTLTNDSNSTVKILSKGYAYCSGESGDIKSLFTVINGVGENYKSIKVSKGSTVTVVANLDEYVQFYTIYPTYLYLYVEYRGETFKLSCSTDRYGINKCHTITWLYD